MDKELKSWLIQAENQLIEQEHSNLAFLLEKNEGKLKATILEPFEINYELNIKNIDLYCQVRNVLALAYIYKEGEHFIVFTKNGEESTTKYISVNQGG